MQAVALATVVALVLAALVARSPRASAVANAVTATGLTVPSLALLGLVLPLVGIGPVPSIVIVTFYAILPILRNAIVGMQGVPSEVVEAARGQGMSEPMVLGRVVLPMAWPIILTGIRTATQLSMGVAAIAAYALGPGLGAYIFKGLAAIGGANVANYAVVGTVGIVVVALLADAALVLLGKCTISKGIRA